MVFEAAQVQEILAGAGITPATWKRFQKMAEALGHWRGPLVRQF